MIHERKNADGSITVIAMADPPEAPPERLTYAPRERVDFMVYTYGGPKPPPETRRSRLKKRLAKVVRKLRYAIEELEERLER
jgi:hypothetical protein